MSSTVALKRDPADRPPIRIVLADDSYLARLALRYLFEGVDSIIVVGECEDSEGVAPMVDKERADLLITDIRMPPSDQDDGIRLAARLRETHPALAVIVLSTHAEVAYALKLFESGCDSRGYLLKDRIRNRQQILDAVVTVASGGSVTDPTVVEELVNSRMGRPDRPLNGSRHANSRRWPWSPRDGLTRTSPMPSCSPSGRSKST